MKRLSNAFPIVFLTYYYYPRELGCARIIKKRYYYHSRAIFRPFHALVSREFCPNAKSQSKSGCHNCLWCSSGSSEYFFHLLHLSFRFWRRETISRLRGKFHLGWCHMQIQNIRFRIDYPFSYVLQVSLIIKGLWF